MSDLRTIKQSSLVSKPIVVKSKGSFGFPIHSRTEHLAENRFNLLCCFVGLFVGLPLQPFAIAEERSDSDRD